MATITVRFFGPSREATGVDSVRMEIGPQESVGAVAMRLCGQYEKLGQLMGVRLAVNQAFVPLNQALTDGDEVAVIPPVSGG